jgi:hypothetical protein
MARIYNFPDGKLLEDSGIPVDPEVEMLQSIKDNPEVTLEQIKGYMQQINILGDLVMKIHAYAKVDPSTTWSKQISGLIERSVNFSDH